MAGPPAVFRAELIYFLTEQLRRIGPKLVHVLITNNNHNTKKVYAPRIAVHSRALNELSHYVEHPHQRTK